MPRQARIDAPFAFHHIICRGLERRKIFWDDADRDSFVVRFAKILISTSTRCFAWSLMPNHFHLLLQTGQVPIATVMQRLLTGYALFFNRRHNRVGHLFHNRYKSILCQEEPYLLELVRYIHLNPVRAGIVQTISELNDYSYCGHGRLIGSGEAPWQVTDAVLQYFDNSVVAAREKYLKFITEGIAGGKRPELTGGGLVRSTGGWDCVLAAKRAGMHLKSDERILGDSEFVSSVIEAAEERLEKKSAYRTDGVDLQKVAQKSADLLEIDVEQIWRHGKKPQAVMARSLMCCWATRELGISAAAVARRLDVSVSAVTRSAERGRRLAAEKGWCLD